MKHSIIILVTCCFSAMVFSQERSLFSNQEQSLLENLTIKKNDSSLLQELLNDKAQLRYAYTLPSFSNIIIQKQFLESENSAKKNPMPIYKPKGNFKQKSIFPDNTMNYYLLIEPVKER